MEEKTEVVEKAENGKKHMSKQLKWQLFIAIVFTVIGLVNVILLLVLDRVGVFEARSNWLLFGIGFFPCMWLPLFTQWLFKFKWSIGVTLVFDIYVFCAIMLGSMWHVYDLGFGFDKIVHFVGGAMWAILPYDVFKNSNPEKNKLSTPWLAFLLIGFSMMCGGVWEIYEYVSDGIMGNNAQYSAGLVGREALADTMQDLICDLAGAVVIVACLLIYLYVKKRNAQKAQIAEKSE